MKKLFCLLVCGLSCTFLAYGNDFFIHRLAKIDKAPVIDGVLSDSIWQEAAQLSNFQDSTGIFVPGQHRKVYVAYDAEAIYFGFELKLAWEASYNRIADDAPTIWSVDCVEIAIIPDAKRDPKDIRRFVCERAGGRADFKAVGQVKQDMLLWNPTWQSKGSIAYDTYMSGAIWTQEVAIPWESLDISAPAVGSEISAQILHCQGNIRSASGANSNRVFSWSPVPKGRDWLNPQDFGRFIFAGKAPVFRASPDSYFGMNGQMTSEAPVQLTALMWKIGQSGQPYCGAKQQTISGMPMIWPKDFPVLDRTTPAMMYWRIEDDKGLIAGGKYISELKPTFNGDVGYAPVMEQVTVSADLSKMKITEGSSVTSVLTMDKQVLESFQLPVQEGQQIAELQMSTQKVAPGKTVCVVTTLYDKKKDKQGEFIYEFKGEAAPSWYQKGIGEVITPPAPWKEPVIKLDSQGNVKVSIAENAYFFAAMHPLPSQIDLRKQSFLASPAALHLNGNTAFMSSRGWQIKEQNCRGATLQWSGISVDGTHVDANVLVEFDGLAWYHLTLTPAKGSAIGSCAISMDFQPKYIRYMRGCNSMNVREMMHFTSLAGSAKTTRSIPSPKLQYVMPFSANGWAFEENFCNFYWIGGEDRGVFFVLPSLRNMDIKREYSSVIDNEKRFEATINLRERPAEKDRALSYNFGFMLTPTKPIVNRERLWKCGSGWPGDVIDSQIVSDTPKASFFEGHAEGRFFGENSLVPFKRDYMTTVMLPCWKLRTIQNGNPLPPADELLRIDQWIETNARHGIGGSPMLWYDALFTMYGLPHIAAYLPEIECYPATHLPVEQPGTYACPTQLWQDMYLSGAAARMKQGVRSFYMDLTFFKPCCNRTHGCGYWDENGHLQGEIPFLATREFFLRYQNLVKKNDPDGLLVLHGGSTTPMILWTDVNTFGEEWVTAPDYKTCSMEYFQALFASTEQTGTVSNFYPGGILMHYIQNKDKKTTLAEMCGMSFTHGESLWNGTSAMLPGMRLVWDTIAQFGIKDARWVPYWRNPRSTYPNGAVISSWKKENGHELLVVFNPEYKPIRLSIDSKELFVNAMTEKIIPEEIELPPREFLLLKK